MTLEYVNESVEFIPEECRVHCALNYDKLVNPSLREGIERWVHLGYPPGDFLTAVICNDLRLAACHADDNNRLLLADWAIWFINNPPALCWGSKEKAIAWQEHRKEASSRPTISRWLPSGCGRSH